MSHQKECNIWAELTVYTYKFPNFLVCFHQNISKCNLINLIIIQHHNTAIKNQALSFSLFWEAEFNSAWILKFNYILSELCVPEKIYF